MGWLTGWSYRKSITLSRASGEVTNYQMKVLLGESSGASGEDVDCGGLCLSNFNDIRFTKSDGVTLLDYWIESISGTTPNQLATVWIEFDYIGTGAITFYMYYGNVAASAVSNGSNTFLDFDDFTGSNDDPWSTEKWDSATHGTLHASAVADIQSNEGRLYQASQTNTQWSGLERRGKNILSLASDGLSIRSKTTVQATAAIYHGFGFCKNGADLYDGPLVRFQTYTAKVAIADHIGEKANVAGSGTHIYELQVKQWQARLMENDSQKIAFQAFSNTLTDSVRLSCMAWSNSSTLYERMFDYVLVRKYLTAEPTWGSWGQENAPKGFNYLHARRDRMNMRGVSTQNQLA